MITDSTRTATLPVVRVSIDLTPGGIRNVMIYYNLDEERDEAIHRLDACLPLLSMLETELQKGSPR